MSGFSITNIDQANGNTANFTDGNFANRVTVDTSSTRGALAVNADSTEGSGIVVIAGGTIGIEETILRGDVQAFGAPTSSRPDSRTEGSGACEGLEHLVQHALEQRLRFCLPL